MKAIFNLIKGLIVIFVLALLAFYFWPATTVTLSYDYPQVPTNLSGIEKYVGQNEAAYQNIKPGNEAKIVWNNDTVARTEYVLVYLHGFSASHEEGAPAHREVAKRFGMNLYLARLAQHGLEGADSMGELTAEKLMATAIEAVAIGKQLGNKVILMGTSTGATLGLPIMANDPSIHAGIFYSANIDLADSKSDLLTQPFGLHIARTVLDSDYYSFNPPAGAEQFWTHKYPIEATVELQTLMNSTMNRKTFNKVNQPTLLVSYFKNEEEQDEVVSVAAIRECYTQLGTDENQKRYVELPDVGGHAMCSKFFSKNPQAPIDQAISFIKEILKIAPEVQ